MIKIVVELAVIVVSAIVAGAIGWFILKATSSLFEVLEKLWKTKK